jgi:hypothetical protein
MTTPTLIERLRNTPNWQRESYGDWKQGTVHYDRAPFEAAGALEAQAAEIERLTQDRDEWKQSTIDANTNARSEEAKRRAMQDERDTLKAELAALKAQPTEPAPSMAGELSDAEIEERFDAFASLYDQESNEWLDMGADVYFRAGYRAALLQFQAAPARVPLTNEDYKIIDSFLRNNLCSDNYKLYNDALWRVWRHGITQGGQV